MYSNLSKVARLSGILYHVFKVLKIALSSLTLVVYYVYTTDTLQLLH